MRAVVQRVKSAEVRVAGPAAKPTAACRGAGRTVGVIGQGLVVLLGVGADDGEGDADYLAEKVAGLRIFPDEQDKMNLSATDIRGEVMVISQFTLYGDVRRGKRPSFTEAAPPDRARALYEHFVRRLKALGIGKVATGEFQAMMDVSLVNAGPVTILLDSRKAF